MRGEVREPKPQEVFYRFGEKVHFLGVAESKEDKVYVFWAWNKWKKRRYYEVIPWRWWEDEWKYLRKTKG